MSKDRPGDVAGPMAGAPLTPRDGAAAEANPYDAFYVQVVFRTADGAVYGETGRTKTKKVASVLAIVRDNFGTHHGQIVAEQAPGTEFPIAVFRFVGSRGGGPSITVEDARMSRLFEAWKNGVVASYLKWRAAAGPAIEQGSAILTDLKL